MPVEDGDLETAPLDWGVAVVASVFQYYRAWDIGCRLRQFEIKHFVL